ncbi:HNH endonuclease [Mycolicibacterium sp. PAM1]|uniref:HNH endonuclease signature motif containing protein n=1 Tax=Mycolicibacterium sp. PAM1 TaxID=2853535 RepID=UPI001C3E4706|nr:HNH endonuclease signature motif containing protein [Mycolicibacterium sp. PAM1]MBV5245327.1 HNH endonuclease [Mycolicibacterium sp. PAM1]
MFDSSVPEPAALAGLSDAELVDAAGAAARAENAVCARKLAVMAELFTRRVDLAPEDRLNWWVDPDAAVAAEIAAAVTITQGLATHQTYRAVVLRDRLPKVGALFLQGLLSELLVRAIITRTDLITDPELIAAVDADLAADILRWGPQSAKKTEAAIDHIVERHDPDAVRQTRQHDVGRTIEIGNPGDAPGYTTVWARMFAGDAAAGHRTLTTMAYSVCDNDPRTLDERRNDALTALFHGITTLACRCGHTDCDAATNPRPPRELTVYALTDQTTANIEETTANDADADGGRNAGNGDGDAQPPAPKPRRSKPTLLPGRSGYLFGSGFMPAPLFDALLDDALLDGAKIREILHPGQAGPEPRYTPSTALADFIRCRDLTCRFPGCDTPATEADIDHTVAHPVGPTHASNLKCLCRFHHLLKTFWTGRGGWHDRQHPDGTITWTSPTGHTYITHPGSRLLFPTLCKPTATLWTGDPPQVPIRERRGAMMPRRAKTRAHSRAVYITAQRRRNAAERADGPRGNDPPF